MELKQDQFDGLPGAELIRAGIDDLAKGILSETALLVLIAQPRLEDCGIDANYVPPVGTTSPILTHALYEMIENRCGKDAHSQYNALLRRLSSFIHAIEREEAKRRFSKTSS